MSYAVQAAEIRAALDKPARGGNTSGILHNSVHALQIKLGAGIRCKRLIRKPRPIARKRIKLTKRRSGAVRTSWRPGRSTEALYSSAVFGLYEHKTDSLLSREKFVLRVINHATLALLLLLFYLGLGVPGYHFTDGFSWLDSLLNSDLDLLRSGNRRHVRHK